MKFLGRAKQFLRDLATEPESKVQYFHVTCPAGHRVSGERTEGYQSVRCPACGDRVFVLPKSPLPNPAAPARASRPKGAGATAARAWDQDVPAEWSAPAPVAVEYEYTPDDTPAADAEIIWDDEPQPSAVAAGPSSPPSATPHQPAPPAETDARGARAETRPRPARAGTHPGKGRPAATAATTTLEPAALPAGNRPTDSAQSARAADPLPAALPSARGKGWLRPSLVFWLVPALVVATIGWRYIRQKRLDYPLVAERGRAEGIPALEEGKFDKAHHLLSAARIAVDALGGAIDDADAIRTAADEAAIFVDLCPKTLEEMLEEAGRTADPAAWQTRFHNLYENRSIIIDSRIEATPGTGQSTGYEIEYRIFPSAGTVQFTDSKDIRPDRIGTIDFQGFQLFELARPRVGDRVAFGARLASFLYDGDRDRWVVRFEPQSGVFIQHAKALEALGWPATSPAEQEPETKR